MGDDNPGDRYRSYLNVMAPHFHICNGSRPTAGPSTLEGGDRPPAFYQHEAWPVRDMVMDHLIRLAQTANTPSDLPDRSGGRGGNGTSLSQVGENG